MADLATLLQPRIVDRESFQEFVEALEDQVPGIERDIAALRRTPNDRGLIARLFRALHTIKGDAALCKVDIGVAISQRQRDTSRQPDRGRHRLPAAPAGCCGWRKKPMPQPAVRSMRPSWPQPFTCTTSA